MWSNLANEWNAFVNLEKEKELNGGAGSGNFGHQGRPGEVGGSGNGKGISVKEQFNRLKEITDWTPEEVHAVCGYFGDFRNTEKVQEYLRGGDDSYLSATFGDTNVKASQCVETFRKKMANTTFPEDTTLYRGMMIRKDRMERVEQNGFSSSGLQSTSMIENDASRILQEHTKSGNYDGKFYTPVLLKINAKKGGHFAASYIDGEHEIVLPDSSQFKIKKKSSTSWGAIVYEVDYE